MKTLDEILASKKINIIDGGADGFRGTIHLYRWSGTVVCSTGAGWEHVSVSPFKKHITPEWSEMNQVKDIFWNDDEAVIQIHPPKAQYVNNMPNCLHLWRCSYRDMILPPSVLVGVREGQTKEEFIKELGEAYEIAGEPNPFVENKE